MTMFSVDHTPAEIVKIFPKASDLFKSNRIDFCCGGHKPLKETFQEKSISGEGLLQKLNSQYEEWKEKGQSGRNWEEATYSDLVDEIVHTHHAYLTEELPALGQFVTKIFRVHGEHHPHLKELYQLYHSLKTELELHLVKEEQDVFPLIKEYEQNPTDELKDKILRLNATLEEEHQDAGDILKRMRDICTDFNPPADACNSYRITYMRLAELEDDMFQHIHKENNILFPRLATA